ncbi:hypothetical protein K432DRAFT_394951 [Lepidopterella palustris CBS 459.81]|uniref:Uncharacterized protein n=1 Tax=Lepidopterella palustris CBS 459.81 TaxID=1314670 RepID=A0A8E2E6C7_9PEZI|nr:hypothetical protein K432DRAFT_394951 [Lepidopterella palustris CBS 459.81]
MATSINPGDLSEEIKQFVYAPGTYFLKWPAPPSTCVIPLFHDNKIEGFGRFNRKCRHCNKIWLDPVYAKTGEAFTVPIFDNLIVHHFRPCYVECIHCGKDLWEFHKPLGMDEKTWKTVLAECGPQEIPNGIFKMPNGKLCYLVRIKTWDVADPENEVPEDFEGTMTRLRMSRPIPDDEPQGNNGEAWALAHMTLDEVKLVVTRPLATKDEISRDILDGIGERL